MATDIVEFEDEDEAGFSHNKFIVYAVFVPIDVSTINKKDYKGRLIEKEFHIIYLYFPNTYHTNTHGGNPITQAGIAELNIIKGKWAEAFKNVAAEKETWYKEKLDTILKRFLDRELQAALKNRIKALSIKPSRDLIRTIRTSIEATKTRYEKNRTKRNYLRNLLKSNNILGDKIFASEVPVNLYGYYKEEWVKSQKSRLKRRLIDLEKKTRGLRSEYLGRKKYLEQVKQSLYKKYDFSKTFNTVDDLSSHLKYIDENEKSLMKMFGEEGLEIYKDEQEARLEMLMNPFMFGFNIKHILYKAAKEMRNSLANWIIGAKSPPLSDKTIKNRKSRNIKHDIPLNETGEFAESLKFEVV